MSPVNTAGRPDGSSPGRLAGDRLAIPEWLKVRAPSGHEYRSTRDLVRRLRLHTVCEEAACPNIGECWRKRHATFMIMGSICTRACAFCNVATGHPLALDPNEPERVAQAVAQLELSHAVITSVDRDDLPDGGAGHFVRVIEWIRKLAPKTTVEVLTPDFRMSPEAAEVVFKAGPDVFNHNLETVPRLYPSIRPGARYFNSLRLLERAKGNESAHVCHKPRPFTKSGLMVGLGETFQEVLQVMDDLRSAGVDFLTIGQYLRPTPKHARVERFVPPHEFQGYAARARAKGFLMVSASPLTRSSYHAGSDFEQLRAVRELGIAAPQGTGRA